MLSFDSCDNTVLDLALSRQHDDGDIRGIANGAANALAGDLGEHKVEHDQVCLLYTSQSLFYSMVGRQGFEPWTLGLKVPCSAS